MDILNNARLVGNINHDGFQFDKEKFLDELKVLMLKYKVSKIDVFFSIFSLSQQDNESYVESDKKWDY